MYSSQVYAQGVVPPRTVSQHSVLVKGALLLHLMDHRVKALLLVKASLVLHELLRVSLLHVRLLGHRVLLLVLLRVVKHPSLLHLLLGLWRRVARWTRHCE